MKIWGRAHPKHIDNRRLLGEHFEIHMMLNGGWPNHPETKRMLPADKDWLVFRHELVRMELERRWPGRHTLFSHKTPVDLMLLEGKLQEILDVAFLWDADDVIGFVFGAGFPPTALAYDTPWDKYGLARDEYVRDWKSGVYP